MLREWFSWSVRGSSAGVVTPSAAPAVPEPATPPVSRMPRITAATLERAKQRAGSRGQTVSQILAMDAFAPAQPPPGVVPKGEELMAQDSNIETFSAWAAQNFIASAFAEGYTWLGYTELAVMAQRPEYRRMSERLATEMTRKWIEFESTGDESDEEGKALSEKIKQVEAEMDRLHVRDIVRDALMQDGFFGRGHIYLDTGDTDEREELKKPIGDGTDETGSKVKVNPNHPLRALRNVEAVWTYPTEYDSNDPLKGDWYNPRSWFVMGKEIHRSRLLTLIGRPVPDILKPAYSFGGLSLTQMAKPYVDNWLETRQSVNDIISAFSVFVLMTDLGTNLQGNGDQLFNRLDLFNACRDNRGVMAVDKNTEDFKNIAAPITGLDNLQAQAQEHMCSVSGIPTVVLLGIQPAGLNASSEGELRAFYDWVHSFQESLVRLPLTTIIRFVQLSLFGEVDDEITFQFVPLWSMDEKAAADVEKTKADTHATYVEMGATSPEEVRKSLADDPAAPYSSLDVSDVPEPPVAETGEPFNEGKTVAEEPEEPVEEQREAA